jgi:predicted SAM-dependent methyltransferase
MDWSEVRELDPIWLNLGGYGDCHPQPGYEGYVAVGMEAREGWTVGHDLNEPFPLPDGLVDRILSEHCLEHLPEDRLPGLLVECHRVLQPGGFMRFAVPDYGSPRNTRYRDRGFDPHHTDHLNFPTHEMLEALVEASPFRRGQFHQYWSNGIFVDSQIDYCLGWVKRTKDNDPRNRRQGVSEHVAGFLRDVAHIARSGFRVDRAALATVRGRPLRMTSIVVDLEKQR